jgi:hypothetical protein
MRNCARSPACGPRRAKLALVETSEARCCRDERSSLSEGRGGTLRFTLTMEALPLPLAGEGWGGGAAAIHADSVERVFPTRIASFDAMRPPPQAGEVKRLRGPTAQSTASARERFNRCRRTALSQCFHLRSPQAAGRKCPGECFVSRRMSRRSVEGSV